MPRTRRDTIITRAQALRLWQRSRLARTAAELALMERQMRSRLWLGRPRGLSAPGGEKIREAWLDTHPAAREMLDRMTTRIRNPPKPSRRHDWRKATR